MTEFLAQVAAASNDVTPALEVHSLEFKYPARRKLPADHALRGVSLTVPAGQSVAILGPNGSGKSTLLKLTCGMLPQQSGSVRVFGLADSAAMRRLIGVVFQNEGLDRHMTVFENLRDQATLYGITQSQAADVIEMELIREQLIDRGHSRVKTLSKGLARRVDLLRAVLHKPRLLLLDEPTVGLDPSARRRFLDDLDERKEQSQLTIVLSTHLVDEADRQDRVLLMNEGQIVADGSPTELRKRAGVRRITLSDQGWQPPPAQQSMWQRTSAGWTMSLDEDDPQRLRQLAADLAGDGASFSIAPPTLGDVFEQLTGRRLSDAEAVQEPHEAAA